MPTYVVRRSIYMHTPERISARVGDLLVHTPHYDSATLYRQGEIVSTFTLSTLAISAFLDSGNLSSETTATAPPVSINPVRTQTTMRIETIPANQVPPEVLCTDRNVRSQHWEQLKEALLDAKVGHWLRIEVESIPGKGNAMSKRNAMLKAVNARKMGKVVSRILGPHIYLQLQPVAKKQQ